MLAKEADREIKERLRCGRVVTLDEALDIIVRERRKLQWEGAERYEKKLYCHVMGAYIKFRQP